MIGARFLCQGRPLTITGQHDGHGPDDPPGWYYRYDGQKKEHWISAGALPIRFKNLEDDMTKEGPKITIHDVLLKLGEIRKLTCPPTGEEIKTIGIDQVVQADQLLLDLQERLLDGYGSAPQDANIAEYNWRAELIDAAKAGISVFLRSTRGAAIFGANAKLADTKNGFVVTNSSDDRVYFDTMEM